MRTPTDASAIPDGIDASEWQARCDTAATYRLQAKYRMTDLTGGFIGGRIPGNGHFLVKPYDQFAEEARASDLVKVGLDRCVVGNRVPNDASVHTCAAIFDARPELNGVVHAHTRASAAVASLECGLQPVIQSAFLFYGRIGYADYDFDLDESTCHLMLEALGEHKAVLMRHHGLLTVGHTLAEAFYLAYFLNQACDVQLAAMWTGRDLHEFSPEECEHWVQKHQSSEIYAYDGAKEWEAWLRMLDREGQSYRS